jgi:hypothetical protein
MGKHTKRVEIRPGVTVNLRPEDRKAFEKEQQQDERPERATAERAIVDAPETATSPAARARKK